ncbi:MAG TPA: ATP-binding cassette domain-containing protein [Candidatus Nanoarchaeia archaeon]|nr:ATP-binding cassette domain-containing protein [Candidatus Nanoarchaeia archaeon]
MIQAKNLNFRYEEDWILKNISLSIKEGSFTAIIGPNGSGKSTLAKHFNAILAPSGGNVYVDGVDTKKDEFNARKEVGFVFQNFEDQLVYSTVEEDVGFGLENLEFGYGKIKEIVSQILNQLKISHLAKRNVNMISLGQKQLVALAGVLAMKPKYIIFDEPTTMLDAKNKKNIMEVIEGLNKKEKIGVILITNVLDDLKYADSIIVLKDGKLIFDGKKSQLNKKILTRAGLYD